MTDKSTTPSEDLSSCLLEQWVASVAGYSSAYNGPNGINGPNCVLGHTSNRGWMPQSTGAEHITVVFDQVVAVRKLHIHFVSGTGMMNKISCRVAKSQKSGTSVLGKMVRLLVSENSDEWVTLWEVGSGQAVAGSCDFSPILDLSKQVRTKEIKVEFTNSGYLGMNGIMLVGVPVHREAVKPPQLSLVYKKMFEDGLFTDVILVHKCSGKQIKAHKFILCQRSEFFKTILNNEMIESKTSTIEFEEDIPFEIFKDVIAYIYSSSIEFSMENLVCTYLLGDQLLLEHLKTLCGKEFASLIDHNSVFSLNKMARDSQAEKLKEIAMEYIVEYYADLVLLPDFNEMEKEELLYICRRLAEKYRDATTKANSVATVVDSSSQSTDCADDNNVDDEIF